ncbi:TonB-dependent siderophore receptor [Paracandidimonas soli]|uniref:TonB-dependent siderophore receptor n=1 Tax=Paracandidimonas soli TaxID=1917182 RepID=UPI00333F7355
MSRHSVCTAREAVAFSSSSRNSPGFRMAPMASLIQLAFAGSVLVLSAWPASAQAQAVLPAQASQQNIRRYDIPAGPLSTVLARFASESGVLVAGAGELGRGKTSPGLSGSLAPQAALDALLAGTGLAALPGPGGTYRLREIPRASSGGVAQLGAVTVTGSRLGETTEGTGSYTTRAMSTATRLSLSPRETPQSVSVLTRQQMEDQGISTLDDAVQSITGLVMQKGYYSGNSGSFSARGFAVDNMMLDGLPTGMGANGTFNADNADLAIYDRIEVVRGANGLTSGSGNPAASINLVRKRPTAEPQVSLTASAGSWDNYQLQLDAADALNKAKTLRGRAVFAMQDKDNFYSVAHDRTQQLYGILEADIASGTTLTFGAHYRKYENDGGYQEFPTRDDGSQFGLPRSTTLGNAYDFWNQTDTTVFAEIDHRFANGWKARLSAVKRWQKLDMMFSSIGGSEGAFTQNTQAYWLDNSQTSLDAMLSGPLDLFGRTHEAVIGVSQRKAINDNYGDWSIRSNPLPLDPWNWDPHAAEAPGPINPDRWTYQYTLREKGLYSSARFSLSDPLSVIIGARMSWYDYENNGTGAGYKITQEITPYAGLVFDLDDRHSVYASWTEIFLPQEKRDINNELLKPITGTNYELGIKGEYYGGRLNTSLAVFQINQRNRAISDLSGPNPCPGSIQGYCQRASGEVESKGVELEVSGELMSGWQATAGYTYVSAKYVRDSDPANVGKPFDTDYPRHQFKASTTYRLPGDYSRWRVGGSLYVQSGIRASDDERIQQGGYAIFGLHAGYRFNDKLDLRLNVNNLFDKMYYQGLGWSTGGNSYGAPRNFMLTLNYQL